MVGSWDKELGLREEECSRGGFFWGGGAVRLWSLESLCVVGTHRSLQPPSPVFSDSRKDQCDRTAICNADHVQEEGKKKLGINGPVSIC